MKTLLLLQHITLHPHEIHTHFNQPHRETPFPLHKWRLQSGPKGFTGSPKNKEAMEALMKSRRENNDEEDDDKIPDVVWKRMVPRIMFFTGVPLGLGFVLLQAFSLLKEGGTWDVPTWVPFTTTFLTFGASALGIAIGSLSTSLNEEEEGSLFGVEQLEKNWDEMWKEENKSGNR